MPTLIRRIAGVILVLIAIGTAHHFVEYRLEPVQTAHGSRDFIESKKSEILFLGWADIAPPPGSEVARFHGRIPVERGIFARNDRSPLTAIIGGILFPLLIFVLGIWLVLRKAKMKPL